MLSLPPVLLCSFAPPRPVTGMVVPQQTALEICEAALSSTKRLKEKKNLTAAVEVLAAAVDKVCMSSRFEVNVR